MRNLQMAAMAIGAACALTTQSKAQSFEVASIRLHDTELRMVGMQISGPRVTISAYGVNALVGYAYNLKMYQVIGGPGLNAELYDIAAKAPGNAAVTRDQVRPMIQALLAERFHVTVHREMREMSVYLLVPSAKGPKLKQSPPDAEQMMRVAFPRGVARINTTKGSMEQMIGQLSGSLDRPVLDKTGLTGAYDYTLEYAGDNAPPDSNAPSIFTALEEQLGLKLESAKAQIEVVVIDHAEKPTPN